MKRERIDENVKRRLYAESMGRCMNPDCQTELFMENGDIIEKAHIVPYCKTADNVFDNLVVLCPNCHTKYDKNSAFESEQVKEWKRISIKKGYIKNDFREVPSKHYTQYLKLPTTYYKSNECLTIK